MSLSGLFRSVVLVGLVGCSACSKGPSIDYSADGPPAFGDRLVDASIGDARHLNPVLVDEVGGADISYLVFDSLLRYDKDLVLRPSLAESYKVSPDGRVITYKLRKGVKFHDGVEFTAEDVVFTWKTYSDPAVKAPDGSSYQDIAEARALDRSTVRVTYKRVFAPALGLTFQFILPKHLLQGKDINKDPFDRHPIGTGPYKFVEWKADQRILLEANPDYWGGKPQVARYEFRVIPDKATCFLGLLNGSVDALGAWNRGSGLTAEQYKRQTDTPKFKGRYNAYIADKLAYTYLGWNLKKPLFKDKAVRQALTMAIDRQAILDNVLYGLGTISTSPYARGSWAEDPSVRPWPFDPARAKVLLEKAGWKDTNGDGLLDRDLDGDGKRDPFKFTLMTNQGNSDRAKIATIVQSQLEKVGVGVDIQIVEWTAFLSQFVDKRVFDAVVLGWTLEPDPDCYQMFHSSQMKEEHQFNYSSYSDPRVDRLLEEGRGTLDLAKRKKAYRAIHAILHEDLPYTFLYVPKLIPAIHKRFKGYAPLDPWDPRLHQVKDWYVPVGQQKSIE